MTRPALGVLYPGHSGERDYRLLADALDVPLRLLHTEVGEDLHAEASLRAIGQPGPLIAQARAGFRDDVGAVLWACTSGSFVFGWDGARAQSEELSEGLGVPVTSTSLAFVSAARGLGARRVAVAGTYPADVAGAFGRLLTDAGLEVAEITAAGIMTGAEVGLLESEQVVELVRPSIDAGADAILVPDTALSSFEAMPRLEREFHTVVLTANQVTMWAGMHLLDRPWSPRADRRRALGALHDVPYAAV